MLPLSTRRLDAARQPTPHHSRMHSYGLGFTFYATRFPEVRGVEPRIPNSARMLNLESPIPHAYRFRFKLVQVMSSAAPPSMLTYHHTYPNPHPQAFFPGRFDLAFSSHNLWHLCIIVAVCVWYNGLIEYSEALQTLGCGYLDEPPPK